MTSNQSEDDVREGCSTVSKRVHITPAVREALDRQDEMDAGLESLHCRITELQDTIRKQQFLASEMLAILADHQKQNDVS
jgi:hypothetical protein